VSQANVPNGLFSGKQATQLFSKVNTVNKTKGTIHKTVTAVKKKQEKLRNNFLPIFVLFWYFNLSSSNSTKIA